MPFSNKILLLISISLMLIPLASAYSVKIDILESFEGEPVFFMANISENLVEFTTEFYNKGSVPYKARARIDIFDNNSLIFSGWSKEKPLMTGNRDIFRIFWYSENAGNFTALLRVYFGNEIFTYDSINVTINKTSVAEDAIEISVSEMSYSDIKFNIESKSKETVLIPYEYPTGWMFEQAISDNKEVIINYEPSLWLPRSVSVYAVSSDGKYYGKEKFMLDVEENPYDAIIGIFALIFRILL